MKKCYLPIILSILFISCGHNRLKTDEKKLANQILTEEEQLTQQEAKRAEREKQLADSIAKLPKGFRFKENRNVDPQNPPVVIDIAGNRTTTQKIKLSSLFSKVEYIRMEQDPDSAGSSFWVAPNHIYMYTGLGSIYQFDRKGHFIQTVCKGNKQFTEKNGLIMTSPEQQALFEGANGTFWNGDKLCYQYENRPAKQKYLMTFDDQVEGGTQSVQLPGSVESKSPINGKGEIKADLLAPKSGKTGTPYLLGNSTVVMIRRLNPSDPQANFFNVLSTSGDTLCEFKNFDPIKNFTKSVSRGVDDGDSYYFNGMLHIRQAFNDTVYQLIPPNRLVPKYILNFGEMGIKSASQGVDPYVSLKDKLVLQSFVETNNYLFITYSKDYSCPNTAKNGTLKFSRVIYNKKSRGIIPIYIDEAPFTVAGNIFRFSPPDLNIENDLDEMPFLWPRSVTFDGKVFTWFSGESLLKLKNPNLPVKNILKNDRIIAIYQ